MSSDKFIFDKHLKDERDYWLAKLSRIKDAARYGGVCRPATAPAEADVCLEVEVSGETYDRLLRLTGGSPFLVYTFLMVALKVCLGRHTGSDTIVVGCPALKELGQPNVLAIVDEIDERQSFRQLLLQVRENLLEAYARQRYPFERLQLELRTEATIADAPAPFDAVFAMPQIHGPLPALNAALTLVFEQSAERLTGLLRFDAGRLCRWQAESFTNHLMNIVREATKNPSAFLRDVCMLSADEEHLILRKWNDTRVAQGAGGFVQEMFGQHAARTPDSTAIEFDGKRLSYAEVNARANHLARYLSRLGIGPDSLVGLCVDLSPEMVIGVLGILKAGGAYLPLDPASPRERLAFTLSDGGCEVLLTQRALASTLPEFGGTSVCLDSEWDEIARESAEEFCAATTTENLAYVIYTSGSTGRPKGVMVTHGGLANYLRWAASAYEFAVGDGAPLHSTFAFDLSVTSLLGPLVAGRRVILAAGKPDAASLADALRQHENFSVVKATPAHVRLLGQQLRGDEVAGRARFLVIGGEALSAQDIAFWQRYAPETRIINEYGPTETVVGCCVYEVPAGEALASGSIPIGRPIANTCLFILDGRLRPQPVGVSGELYIGGDGLARGYLRQPGLTAEKFIPNPFASLPGSRLYRTGDLARYLPDGNIEFLGRRDSQVKIRGYRIELGEVEAALAAHPSVREVAVVLGQDGASENLLIAYVVAEAVSVTGGELRAFLKEFLPEYMLPAFFVTMDGLPLTENGKVDRCRLPAPEHFGNAPENIVVAPRTPTEEVMAGIWSQVLGVPAVGLGVNFFDLGGHSLLITQIISRIREAFGVEVAMRALFGAPSVEGMSRSVEAALGECRGLQAPPVVRVPRDKELPLSFAQQRLWFLEQLMPGTAAFNIPEAIRLTGPLDVHALEHALDELIRRHESLRTTFPTVEGRAMQVISTYTPLRLHIEDLRGLPRDRREAEALRLAAKTSQSPFDLATGPLFNARLLRLADEQYVALFNTHHIISDAWSIGVMVREVAALYSAYATGKASPLAELPVQYADYAAWQRAWMQGKVLEEHLAYWKRQLAGAPPILELRTDRPRPEVQTVNGARHLISLGSSLVASLKELSRREGVTLFMTLLAAYKVVLHHWSGKEDILIGTDVANRNRQETENLIGFFINQLVLRSDLSGDPSFREFLRRVREVTLGAYAHQDLPFEKLVEALKVERSLRHTPLVQVKMVFQNAPTVPFELPHVTVERIANEGVTSDFDLTLTLFEHEGIIKGRFEYSSDLFDASTIAGLTENLGTLLTAVAEDPQRPLSTLMQALEEKGRRRQTEREEASVKDLAQKFQNVRRKSVSVAVGQN